MNGPQWNDYSFQPPLPTDPSILLQKRPIHATPLLSTPYTTTYNPPTHIQHTHQLNGQQNVVQPNQRETGIIEKIVTSYGFIRCNERKARIFFHFTEFNGDIATIAVGDMVEFHTENHPKTNKPVACAVIRLEPLPQPVEVLSDEKFHGSLVKEAKPLSNGCFSSQSDGMLTYQNCGESFFVPYSTDDICGDPNIKFNPGDQLLFYVATDILGNIRARQVEFLVPVQPQSHLPTPLMPHSPIAVVQPQYIPQSQPHVQKPPCPHIAKTALMPITIEKSPTKSASASHTHLSSLVPTQNTSSTSLSNKTQPTYPSPNSLLNKANFARLPYQGVICSLKESFGFIERSDLVREIFFHFSEYRGKDSELKLGADVQFDIQTRNNKEVAIHVESLAEGTVVFEDTGKTRYTGTITKVIQNDGNRRNTDPLSGRLVYDTPTGQKELPYGDKDQNGDFTMFVGDVVKFSIATDRRDKLERASGIDLLPQTFEKNNKDRELGTVSALKDGYGFIQCSSRDARLFFHFSEILFSDWMPQLKEEVEFSVTQDLSSPNWQLAIRVRAASNANFVSDSYTILPEKYIGTINTEAGSTKNGKNKSATEAGKIIFDYKSAIKSIAYHTTDLLDGKGVPKVGDKIDFQIAEDKTTSAWKAVNVKLVIRTSVSRSQGFIATLKDNFGFIELADHDKEVFFHFSACDGDPNDLDLGDEVDFTISRKSNKVSAENIRHLDKGTITAEELKDNRVLVGQIVRPMRIVNPDQDEYSGMVQATNEENELIGPLYPYGITSLADTRDFLQEKDAVKFQVAVVKSTGKERAINVAAKRAYIRAKVDSVKGQYGFLDYDADVGKKLFFHMTEVHDNADVNPGDEVEFVVIKNQRNGKYSACSLRKISTTQRPDRLLTRLKSMQETKSTFCVIRQPRGPDGTSGFHKPRKPWKTPSSTSSQKSATLIA